MNSGIRLLLVMLSPEQNLTAIRSLTTLRFSAWTIAIIVQMEKRGATLCLALVIFATLIGRFQNRKDVMRGITYIVLKRREKLSPTISSTSFNDKPLISAIFL